MAMDWVEYVLPELRESFAENLSVVMADLATLTAEDPDGEEDSNGDDDEDDGEEGDEEEVDEIEAGDDRAEPGPVASGPQEQAAASAEPVVPHFALTIPSDHAEAWFRAMNQARIVLSARYGIDSEHVPELAKLLEAGQIEYWFQYELFVSLQGWLVEVVLDPE
jgi:hypothetical protein